MPLLLPTTSCPPRSVALAVCAALAGCQPQATERYVGEPLLSMQGTVEIAAASPSAAVVPALCFAGKISREQAPQSVPPTILDEGLGPDEFQRTIKEMYIVDAEVHGSFPAAFNVDVYEPPPRSLLKPFFTGEPPFARASICAVKKEHPPMLSLRELSVSLGGYCDPQNGPGPCIRLLSWALPDYSKYYIETMHCPSPLALRQECSVTSEGDPSVPGLEDSAIVGTEERYQVVYLAAAAPAGGYTATYFGAPAGLTAGYHVIDATTKVAETDHTPAEVYSWQLECSLPEGRVQLLALEAFNQQHGTDLTINVLEPVLCNMEDPDTCADTALQQDFVRIKAPLSIENGCVPFLLRPAQASALNLTLKIKPPPLSTAEQWDANWSPFPWPDE